MGCPNLHRLNLSFCGSAVSDSSLRSIGLHLLELRALSVRGCVRVTGVGVEAIVEGCHKLKAFDVSQCKNLQRWLDNGGVERYGWDGALGSREPSPSHFAPSNPSSSPPPPQSQMMMSRGQSGRPGSGGGSGSFMSPSHGPGHGHVGFGLGVDAGRRGSGGPGGGRKARVRFQVVARGGVKGDW